MRKPICFEIKHRNGHSYCIYYFENLDLLVKCSNDYSQSYYSFNSYHPPEHAFKPVSRELFRKIVNSSVFEVE